MKAVLKLCMNGTNTNNSLDLEKMSLYELDCYLMKNFNSADDLRMDEWYNHQINTFLNTIPNREQLNHPNGSIRIFLENDNGEPIMETRAFGGRGPQRVQKQVRVLFNKSWHKYHRSEYFSKIADFANLRDYAIKYYQDYPDAFRELLQTCYRQLRNEYTPDNYGLNNFMNYNDFEDVQTTMLGDSRSLFVERPINIKNKIIYDRQVKDFIYGLRLKNLDEAYLNLREASSAIIDRLELKDRKVVKAKPPIKPETLDDLMRQKFQESYQGKYTDSQIESMYNDYWNYQPEEQQEKRYNRIK